MTQHSLDIRAGRVAIGAEPRGSREILRNAIDISHSKPADGMRTIGPYDGQHGKHAAFDQRPPRADRDLQALERVGG